ncbi:Plastidal glycolate/glycerate translocator 1, chloroplastic [Glycine soja]
MRARCSLLCPFSWQPQPPPYPFHFSNSNHPLSPHHSSAVFGVIHLAVSLGLILAVDKFLKQAFVAAAIKFPSALFGMFCIFSVLIILDSTVPAAATAFVSFFVPAFMFIQRWLPLFYVPSLVVLPLAVKDIPAASGAKIGLILVGGWLATFCVAGYAAIAVRKAVKTELVEAEPMGKPAPFSLKCGHGLLFSLYHLYLHYFTLQHWVQVPEHAFHFCLQLQLPPNVKKVFHPIICCALSADLTAFAFGYFSRSGLEPVLGYYLTKASSNPGAGDILMGFLESVILSFSFSMFKQRKLVKRHAAEIFTSVIISTLFSLYSTAFVGRLVQLEPSLTVSILPRCITVALALSIVSLFDGANSSLTAAVVVLTGLVGANFVQATLDKLSFRDPIARGIATASSAHRLGTAALSAKEPEALPFCAIAYALNGIWIYTLLDTSC